MKLDGSNLTIGEPSRPHRLVYSKLPVVKDLASHYVAAHAPAVLVPLLAQPVVPEHLDVEVMDLVGCVVYMAFGPFEDEEAVVISPFLTQVNVHKGGNVIARSVVLQLKGKCAVSKELSRQRRPRRLTSLATKLK